MTETANGRSAIEQRYRPDSEIDTLIAPSRAIGRVAERHRRALDGLDDADLVAAAGAGDAAAFAALYYRHYAKTLSFCRGRLHNLADAEDVAQETFLRARRALDRGARVAHPQAWLRAIATNLCIDHLQRRYRSMRELEPDRADEHVEEGPEKAVVTTDESLTVRRALANLTPRHREVLELLEHGDFSYAQIADAQQLELSAVKALIFRAREALRREYLLLTLEDGRLAALLIVPRLLKRKFGRMRDAPSAIASGATKRLLLAPTTLQTAVNAVPAIRAAATMPVLVVGLTVGAAIVGVGAKGPSPGQRAPRSSTRAVLADTRLRVPLPTSSPGTDEIRSSAFAFSPAPPEPAASVGGPSGNDSAATHPGVAIAPEPPVTTFAARPDPTTVQTATNPPTTSSAAPPVQQSSTPATAGSAGALDGSAPPTSTVSSSPPAIPPPPAPSTAGPPKAPVTAAPTRPSPPSGSGDPGGTGDKDTTTAPGRSAGHRRDHSLGQGRLDAPDNPPVQGNPAGRHARGGPLGGGIDTGAPGPVMRMAGPPMDASTPAASTATTTSTTTTSTTSTTIISAATSAPTTPTAERSEVPSGDAPRGTRPASGWGGPPGSRPYWGQRS